MEMEEYINCPRCFGIMRSAYTQKYMYDEKTTKSSSFKCMNRRCQARLVFKK